MSVTYISPGMRRTVIKRAGNCCEYCRINQDDQFFAFEIDHIIAEKHGGQTQIENLCLSCPDCNGFKGSDIASIDWEAEAALTRLYDPRQDSWDDHFLVDEASGRIEALTPIGRVTAFLLQLNNSDRVVDRKLLLNDQRYPCVKAV